MRMVNRDGHFKRIIWLYGKDTKPDWYKEDEEVKEPY